MPPPPQAWERSVGEAGMGHRQVCSGAVLSMRRTDLSVMSTIVAKAMRGSEHLKCGQCD